MHPINLATLALAVAAGLCAAWWLFPIGLVVWLAMVVLMVRDPSVQFRRKLDSREPLARRFQPHFNRIERVQINMFRSLSKADPAIKRPLKPVQDGVDGLVEQAHRLCQRMTILENHRLLSSSNLDLKGELTEVEIRIAEATDPLIKREYEQTREALEKRSRDLQSVSNLLDRVEAHLSSLSSTLGGVHTEVLRLQAHTPTDIDLDLPDLLAVLEREAEELKDFDREARRQIL
jgi:hypothetical protein